MFYWGWGWGKNILAVPPHSRNIIGLGTSIVRSDTVWRFDGTQTYMMLMLVCSVFAVGGVSGIVSVRF